MESERELKSDELAALRHHVIMHDRLLICHTDS